MKEHLPGWLRRPLGRLRRALGRLRRPKSTFMRVAYSTPRQVVLITTRHQGVDNIWPIDWHVPLSFEPQLYAIAVNRAGYGTQLVAGSGVFVVNFVPASWERAILFCGNVSGRSVDKFAASGLKKEEAKSIDAPRLAEALGSLECRVQRTMDVGDHVMFIGEVTHVAHRADARRLHHLDVQLKDVVAAFEAGDARPSGKEDAPAVSMTERSSSGHPSGNKLR